LAEGLTERLALEVEEFVEDHQVGKVVLAA
jgi:hypothetical protein